MNYTAPIIIIILYIECNIFSQTKRFGLVDLCRIVNTVCCHYAEVLYLLQGRGFTSFKITLKSLFFMRNCVCLCVPFPIIILTHVHCIKTWEHARESGTSLCKKALCIWNTYTHMWFMYMNYKSFSINVYAWDLWEESDNPHTTRRDLPQMLFGTWYYVCTNMLNNFNVDTPVAIAQW